MTSLGIGSELDSSSINANIPAYPQDETVPVRFLVRARIALSSKSSGVPVNGPPSIKVSSNVSNNTTATTAMMIAKSSSWGALALRYARSSLIAKGYPVTEVK